MQDTMDLLQIKIDNAKSELSEDTLQAIAAVPWQATILKMRETKGYSFEQLNDLEIETELVLCGLLHPADYPKELENRMHISRAVAEELVNEMNAQVFTKIKGELIKNMGRKKNIPPLLDKEGVGGGNSVITTSPSALLLKKEENKPDTTEEEKINTQVLKSAGIEIIEKNRTLPILMQKLSGPLQVPLVKTDHSLPNIAPSSAQNEATAKSKIDPYREIPE